MGVKNHSASEFGATQDQSGSEIKTAYEGEADTNDFSDAEQSKLSGIETGADVTDATNVAVAGAVMKTAFNANTILRATADDTPAALLIAEETLLGRRTGEVISDLSVAEVRQMLDSLTLTNANAGAITQGMAVYISAASSVDKAEGGGTAAVAEFFGLVNEASIATTATGRTAFQGPVMVPTGLQAGGAWAAGNKIYLDRTTAGSLRNVAPTEAGEFIMPVGRCINTPGGGDAIVVIEKGEVTEIT